LDKKNVWRGLTGVTAVLLAIGITGTQLAVSRGDFINSRLGISTYKTVEHGDGEGDATYFESSFTSLQQVVEAQEQLAVELASEGTVLFKNTNGALPLNTATEQVTLWGLNAIYPTRGGTIGSTAKAAKEQTSYDLVEALQARGYTLNQTMLDFYESDAVADYVRKNQYNQVGSGLTPAFTVSYEANLDYSVGEAPGSLYTDATLSSADDTVAVCVLSRSNSEAAEYEKNMTATAGDQIDRVLALSAYEKEMIALAKAHSTKVVVLVNSDCAMEIGDLKNDPDIDAILWVGAPGLYGFLGVADVLSGAVNPSGHITDTYVTNNEMAPAMVNFGLYLYDNNSQTGSGSTQTQLSEDDKGDWYVVETEGIYVGYKYYETRYEDLLLGRGNADAVSGSSTGNPWSYGDEVVYSFGYGLSYTTFSQKLESVDVEAGQPGTATVQVTNTGTVAGKSVVELYVQTPYTEGGVEKAAIQLVGYGKTEELEPGASQEVTIVVDPAYFASYDETAQKADGTVGAWILDAGDYYFAIGNGAHEALNNILAVKLGSTDGLVTLTEEEVIDPDCVTVWTLGQRDCETYSVGVENALQDCDLNNLIDQAVEYTTRSDWTKGWTEITSLTPTDEMMTGLTNSNYALSANGDGTEWGADYGLTLLDMMTVNEDGTISAASLEDERWEQLVSEITLEEAMNFIEAGADDIEALGSIGMAKVFSNDGPIGFAYDQVGGYSIHWGEENASEPTYVAETDDYATYSMSVMPTEPVVAATFNHELVEQEGALFGEAALWANQSFIIAPGVNLHRCAYNARNHEYYSEDSQLTNLMAVDVCTGMMTKGLSGQMKHFAFNHQELNRSGISTFFSEQAARENELRCFQGAMSQNISKSVMTAFNRAGTIYSGAHSGLLDQIARQEWGYTGGFITDMVNGALYMNWLDTVSAGGGIMFSGGATGWKDTTLGSMEDNQAAIQADTSFQLKMKESLTYWLYNIVQTNAMNGVSATSELVMIIPAWQMACYAGCGVLGVLTVLFAVLYGIARRKKVCEEG
jgi:beta-glucosidase